MEKDLELKNGEFFTELGEKVQRIEENNYVFEFKDEILEEIRAWTHKSVVPSTVRNKILDELKSSRADLSVSRPKKRISWGIEVPNDPS
jgi:methionyl-tRNA synthetase